jgi:hypothetical protein
MSMIRRVTFFACATLASSILFLAAATPSYGAMPMTFDDLAKADGLVPMPNSEMAQAWIRPGKDFSGYSAYVLLSTRFAFREPVRRHDDAYPLTDAQKDVLRELVPTAVSGELDRLETLSLTDSFGAHVLLLQISVLDVVSHVPPEPVGRGATFLRSIGGATLAIELRDSMTGELLARAIERREVNSSSVRRSNRVWNRTEVRKATERFAASVRKQMEQFTRI